MPLILAEELDSLNLQDIQEWDQRAGDGPRIHIDVIDKHNLTSERLIRLQCLVRQRDEPSEFHAVDAGELDAKLRQISPRRSPPSSDTASFPTTAGAYLTEEEVIKGVQRIANRNYENLKGMGGRPSREINPDPGPCPPFKSDIDKEYHVSDHWHGESGHIRDELTRWLDFRWHQFKMRENLKIFNKYEAAVRKNREEKGINWAIELQLCRQTKLDEWREYYIYEHWNRRTIEKKLNRVKKELEHANERIITAKQNGSAGVPSSVWSKQAAEMVRNDKKILQAQKKLEMAQKRWDVLRIGNSLSAAERDMLTEQAEEGLKSAQKRLEAERSDKFEQLIKEEKTTAQANLKSCQGKVSCAMTDLKRLDTLLEWIMEQSAELATEYALSTGGSQYNRHLLNGWEKYYVYMRERLQGTQLSLAEWLQCGLAREQTEAEEAMDDLLCPQWRVRPIRALLEWIEREFPEIAARHTLFSQASRSNNDHRGKTDLLYLKPSSSGPACQASPSSVVRKSFQHKGKSVKERSPLRQVRPLKVSKSSQKRERPLNQILSTTRTGVWPPEGHANDAGQEEWEPPKVAVRRSKRISQQARNPEPPHPALVCTTKKPSQGYPNDIMRRSARILNHTKKLDVKPFQSSTISRQQSTRRIRNHTNTAYSGTPQGILKTSHWKAMSKKRRQS